MFRWFCSSVLFVVSASFSNGLIAQSEHTDAPAVTKEIQTFSLGVTPDLVNVPWRLAERRGLLTQIERRHQIRLEVIEFTNERRALQAYDNGDIDALTVSLNALINRLPVERYKTHIPLLYGFSRGDYGVFSREITTPSQLANEKIHVPIGSSGHYMLFRILEFNQISMSEVTTVDTPEENIIQDFVAGEINTLVASGSNFARLRQVDDVSLIADSRSLFGEIVFGVAINSAVIRQHPELGQMLVESWFLTMNELFGNGVTLLPNHTDLVIQLSNLPAAGLNNHLGGHNFLRVPEHALQFMQGDNLQPALLGLQRFREAADIYQCIGGAVDACFIERNDDLIVTGEGAQVLLDTRFLEAILRAE